MAIGSQGEKGKMALLVIKVTSISKEETWEGKEESKKAKEE
jgi:hypothetical protein